MFDCDTHCYETRDAMTRYLPEEFLGSAVTSVTLADGREVILAGSRLATFNSGRGVHFETAQRPGSLKEMLRQMASGHPAEAYGEVAMDPAYQDRAKRLELLDEQGVDRCILFPSALALSAEHWVDDTRALYANVHSFNRWYDETWGFNHQNRIYASAILSLRDRERAVAEVEHILDRGARVVLLPTGPAYGRSPADPYFDPVWARLNEAKAIVAFHIMPFWYFDAISPAWGEDPDPSNLTMSAWQWNNVYGDRPIQDTLSSLIFDNLFGRFPDLRVVAAEHGAEWLPYFVRHMDKSRGMGRNGPWIGGPLKERPSAVFREFIRVTPYPEDDVPRIVDEIGHADCLVLGSDFPHAEGLERPADMANLLNPLAAEVKQAILHDNATAIFDR